MRSVHQSALPAWAMGVIYVSLVCVSLGIGFLGGFFYSAGSLEEKQAAERETVPVVVAAAELAAGHTITARDVVVRQLPKVAVPEPAVRFDATGDVTGLVVVDRVLVNELVRREHLAPPGAAP